MYRHPERCHPEVSLTFFLCPRPCDLTCGGAVRIMEDLMFSAVVVSWERWKQRIAVQQKVERISA